MKFRMVRGKERKDRKSGFKLKSSPPILDVPLLKEKKKTPIPDPSLKLKRHYPYEGTRVSQLAENAVSTCENSDPQDDRGSETWKPRATLTEIYWCRGKKGPGAGEKRAK